MKPDTLEKIGEVVGAIYKRVGAIEARLSDIESNIAAIERALDKYDTGLYRAYTCPSCGGPHPDCRQPSVAKVSKKQVRQPKEV